MNVLGYVLLGLGVTSWFIGDLLYMKATFRRGSGWFFGSLFLPLVDLAFVVAHWRAAFWPCFLSLVGLALAILGVVLIH
jgi:hypothetical protein